MRFTEIEYPYLMEAARIQHAEDIVFWEGSAGAQRALKALAAQAKQGHQDVTVKWDGCLHPDTLVLTSDGSIPINDLIAKHGNGEQIYVMGKSLKSGENILVPVTMAGSGPGEKSWVTLYLENGESITLTADHEVHTSNRGWVPAAEITPEDDITELPKK